MIEALQAFLYLVEHYGLWVVAFFIIIALGWALVDEDRSARFRAVLYGTAHRVTGRLEHEKRYISNDIRGQLNVARRKMHFGKEILPKAVAVAWVHTGGGEVHDIREGEFIVRLDAREQQERNIATLATALVRRSTLTGLRHLIDAPLQTVIDLNLVRTLLKAVGNRHALDWFLENDYLPGISVDPQTGHRNEQIVAIDERGLFTRLLLLELEQFSKEMAGRAPRPYMAGEIEGLVDFLYRLCTRQFGQDVPLRYHRAFIRIGIILVAKMDKILDSIDPYVQAMQFNLQSKSNSIYVLVFDKEWLGEFNPDAHRVYEDQVSHLRTSLETETVAIRTHDVKYICIDQYGSRRKGRCIRFVAPPEPGSES